MFVLRKLLKILLLPVFFLLLLLKAIIVAFENLTSTTTEYVELTKRFIDYMAEEYAVDTDRIYGTGQSMGCMTTLVLQRSHGFLSSPSR